MKKTILFFAIILLFTGSYAGTVINNTNSFYLATSNYGDWEDPLPDEETGSFYSENQFYISGWVTTHSGASTNHSYIDVQNSQTQNGLFIIATGSNDRDEISTTLPGGLYNVYALASTGRGELYAYWF